MIQLIGKTDDDANSLGWLRM